MKTTSGHTTYLTAYKFNGKEMDAETGLYYYGARYYEPELAMWYGADAMAEKYANIGGYVYCANNPVKLVDPDGNENVVVCGAQYDESYGNKLMFVNQGIRALRQYQKNAPNESRSMVLFSKGYTEEQIEAIRNSVESYSGALVLVNNIDEMFNYINNPERESDKILNMEIYSHGLSGSIEFGYKFENNDALRLDKSNAEQLKSSSFQIGASITSYACRTALGNNSSVFTFSRDIDNSLAQKMANSAKVDVFAYASRTSYEGTLGSALDRHPFASIFMPVGVNPMPIPVTKMINGAAFTPHGANRGVTAGTTPSLEGSINSTH